mmetsp:Transcript_15034/g.43864  ORF Transcript_15034/g.43864 Transcript_15034/m.43864 type:complete len:361 (-) Transcript_15034:238-1320(-)
MSAEWDPLADPADEALSGSWPAHESKQTTYSPGEFVEILVAEGKYTGFWVACQVLQEGDGHDHYHVFLPVQPPIVEDIAFLPNIPADLLRRAQSPARQELLQRYYPEPWNVKELSGQLPVAHGAWYPGKPVVAGRKLRVAVLHGTSSNSRIMGHQISRLRTECKDRVEFLFIEGKINAATVPGNPQYALMSKVFPGQDLFQYAQYAAGNMFDYSDLDAVMACLQQQLQEHAPVDGVLGTGQGSNLGTLLAAQAARGTGAPLCFTVHHGGTEAAWTWRFPDLFQGPLPIPSLHVTGEQDPFLHGRPILAHLYSQPEIATHSGDHRPIPSDPREAATLAARILAFMESAAAGEGLAPSAIGA